MPVTLDRTQPVLPLTPPWFRVASIISAALFLVLLVAAAVLLIAGVIWYALCLLGIALSAAVLYILATIPLLLVIAAVAGTAESSKGKKDGDKAIGGVVVIGGIILYFVQGEAWRRASKYMSDVFDWLMDGADGGWGWLTHAANWLWRQFVDNNVYVLAWTVLAAAIVVSIATIAIIGFARSIAPARRVFVRVKFQCPRCPGRNVLYRCPNPKCSTLHAELIPSRHGIWIARCGKCGSPLGTTDVSGRQNLEKVCAACSSELDHPAIGRFPEYHIAVVGAKNSGKTTLMVAALMALEEEFAPARGWRITFANDFEEADYRERAGRMRTGQTQHQTARADRPAAFTISIEAADGQTGALVYLYDAAGEDIQAGASAGEGVSRHDFHSIVDGVILVVDPFAETGVRQAVSTAGLSLPAEVNAAPQDALYVLSRMIPFWGRSRRGSTQGRFSFPIAVVVTKLDAGGLDGRVGGYVEGLEDCPTIADAARDATEKSEEVREFLLDDGVSDLLHLVDSHFGAVEFFGTSALGRTASAGVSKPFQPRGAVAPLIWLLAHTGALTDRGAVGRTVRTAGGWLSDSLWGRNGVLSRLVALTVLAVPGAAILYPLYAWWGLWWTLLFVSLTTLAALVYRSFRRAE